MAVSIRCALLSYQITPFRFVRELYWQVVWVSQLRSDADRPLDLIPRRFSKLTIIGAHLGNPN